MLCYGVGAQQTTCKAVAGGVRFPGTVVVLKLPLDAQFELQEALSFQGPDWEPYDFIDQRYEPDEGEFHIPLARERRGVGSRQAGRAVRTKAENLLRSNPDARLNVDFAGIRMVASSFADEFLGKLRVHLGAEEFDRRIRIVGMDRSIDSVLRGAIAQRMRSGVQ
jgi:hypothetical protein